jgi:hypothetical protein
VCGAAGGAYKEMCTTAKAGALVSPSPPMRDDGRRMAQLGMVGYVDPYAGLLTVPTEAVTYEFNERSKGYYTQMTGTKMQSCRPALKYDAMVALISSDKVARVQGDGTVVFQTVATMFALRPPPGSDRLTGELRYGDSVVFTQTITASDSNCGVYGCGVGRITSGKFEVGPGGIQGGTPITLEAPPGFGPGTIVYGAPVVLSARVSPPGGVLSVNQKLTRTQSLESPSQRYRLVYNADGTAGVYCNDGRTIWVNGTTHNAGELKLTDTALVAYNQRGHPKWTIPANGIGPFTLVVTDAGSIQLVGRTAVAWESPKDPQPGLPAEKPRVIGRLVNNRLTFGSVEGSRFTLDTVPGKRCDLIEVAKQCGARCPGMLYSEADQTWQPLTANAADYRQATTQQYVALKTVSVELDDGSCPNGGVDIVTDFGTPTGLLAKGGKDQCGPPRAAQELPRAYEQAQDDATEANALLTDVVAKTAPKVRELREVKRAKVNPTAAAQQEDWNVVNAQFKSRAVVWCVLAGLGVVLAVILARRRA